MPTLFHHSLDPLSRYVRLVMAEYGLEPELQEEHAFERRRDFLLINPAGTTPVLREASGTAIVGANAIGEFLDETAGPALGFRRLLPDRPHERAEVRRLVDWFNGKFFAEVSSWLVTEKVYRRFMSAEIGGGAPSMELVRAARTNVRYHLRYIGYLVGHRKWLGGNDLSLADLAAAAHLSSVDFLGDVPWTEDEMAKQWYARVKSRPSFRSLLSDRVLGVTPPENYKDLDF